MARIVAVASCLLLRSAVADTCSIYDNWDSNTCGEVQIDCQYVAPAKAFRSTLKDGHCADIGFTVAAGTKVINVPDAGDVTISWFTQASLAVGDTCSIYDNWDADTCGEVQIDCQYVAPAKAFRSTLKDGHCADIGFTVAAGTKVINVPDAGDVTISWFKQASLAVGDTCSIYDNWDADTCGEVQIDCQYVAPAKAFRSTLKDGHCADIGFTVAAGTKVINVPDAGDVTISWFKQASLAVGDTCSIYDNWDADTCGEVQIDCQYVAPAKAFRSTLKDGHCADIGFTVAAGTKVINVPDAGDVTISWFKQASVSVEDTCSIYDNWDADTCGEVQIDCQYVAPAKAFRSTLKDGHCADIGFTVAAGTKVINVPDAGDVTISWFKQALMALQV